MVACIPGDPDNHLFLAYDRREEKVALRGVRRIVNQDPFSLADPRNLAIHFRIIGGGKNKKLLSRDKLLRKPPALVPDLPLQDPTPHLFRKFLLPLQRTYPDPAPKRKQDSGSSSSDPSGSDDQDSLPSRLKNRGKRNLLFSLI